LVLPLNATITVAKPEATKPLEIGVFGGDRVVWAFRRDTSPEINGDLLRFCYQLGSGSSPQRYWPGPVVVGDVAVAVTSGTGLYAFYRDGTHRHYLPDPRIMRTGPPFSDLGEVNAPGEKPPIAACWDEGASCLVAVFTAAQAAAVSPKVPTDDTEATTQSPTQAPEQTAPEKNAADNQAAPASLTAAPPPTITTPFAVVRYAPRQWTVDRATPPDLREDGIVIGV